MARIDHAQEKKRNDHWLLFIDDGYMRCDHQPLENPL
jgi:hypothetical protein